MGTFRFSLATLIGMVVMLAFGLAALRYASQIWADTVLSVTLTILLVAVLGVSFSRGRRRVFWGGFAVIGWAYLVLALGPGVAGEVSPHLLTTKLLTTVQGLLPNYQFRVNDKIQVNWHTSWYPCSVLQVKNGLYLIHYEGYGAASDEWVGLNRIRTGDPESFLRIGHCFFALLLALGGGALALQMAEQGCRHSATRVDSNTGIST